MKFFGAVRSKHLINRASLPACKIVDKIPGRTVRRPYFFAKFVVPKNKKNLNTLDRKPIIAVDGVSGSGKSSIARTIAKKYGLLYVDTGAMYRAVTYYAMRKNYLSQGEFLKNLLIADLNKIKIDFASNGHTLLDGEDVEEAIRSMAVSENVSLVSAVPEVRMAMVLLQRGVSRDHGIVMDGRDIGTVVFPDADVKLFIVSDPRVRAERRYKELKNKGLAVNFDEVLKNITARDYTDSHREISPLVKAPDAVEVDNSALSIEEQNAKIDAIIDTKLKKY